MGKMCRVLEGRGVEGISEMAQEAQQEIGAHLIGIELLGSLMGD
jgi:hypothetical protein